MRVIPAHKKTREDRQREQFAKMLAVGKIETGLTDRDIVNVLGWKAPATLRKRKNDPNTLRLGEVIILKEMFNWDDEEIDKLMTL